jgi:hypothetical protein
MTTITVPLQKKHETIVEAFVRSGFASTKVGVVQKALVALAEKELVTSEDVLGWSAEANRMKKQGRLPVLRSLKHLRSWRS